MGEKIRCPWPGDIPIYIDYHDYEWGRPVHEDGKLFEMLLLESMQAGLAWITILKKRENYRLAFDGFDPVKIARYDEAKVAELLGNEGIIRNRLKIHAAIANAQAFLRVQEQYGSFDKFLWGYVDDTPVIGRPETIADIPATTELSDRISKDLKTLGFKFLGSTTMYAFLQATGVVNDHLAACFVSEAMRKET